MILSGLAILSLAAPSGCERADAHAAPRANATPVLLELFTSEGCSSCPPADAVVARLAATQPVPGARIVVLAHHVDYWDSLGWPDPFASAAATARQQSYARRMRSNYTPQAVVDGTVERVGSERSALEDAIADAAKRPHAKVSVAIVRDHDSLDLNVSVGALPDGSGSEADVVVATVQDHARVDVLRGENAGRTLEHVAITRELRGIGPVSAPGGSLSAKFRAPPAEATVVAFVQDRPTRRILGSGSAPVPRP